MRSTECSTVISMSFWNSGLSRWRSAFFSISDNCATMFFRSWTTNADMRLKASNLRASSSASVACIWPRKVAACRAAVFSRSFTSQFTSTRVRAVARITKPISSLPVASGMMSQAFGSSDSHSGSRSPR